MVSGTSEPKALQPGLYIVATPIGNLGDITLRAIDILQRCDLIACEDTRVTGKLLHHLGFSRPMWRHDDHASDQDRENILAAMAEKVVVLVSDAGTPLISDPGYRLVKEARERGLPVTSLPGASAVPTALSLSGLPTDRFLFAGFLPPKEAARRAVLEELGHVPATLVFFETGQRLERALATIGDLWPERRIVVARELTKLFEDVREGTADELRAHYQTHPARGEIVLLLDRAAARTEVAEDAVELLRSILEHEKASKAAAEVARITGRDRNELYKIAVELKKSEQERR
jgi:16S rRNA (cytidine1402-2'-O)-methyltransferase